MKLPFYKTTIYALIISFFSITQFADNSGNSSNSSSNVGNNSNGSNIGKTGHTSKTSKNGKNGKNSKNSKNSSTDKQEVMFHFPNKTSISTLIEAINRISDHQYELGVLARSSFHIFNPPKVSVERANQLFLLALNYEGLTIDQQQGNTKNIIHIRSAKKLGIYNPPNPKLFQSLDLLPPDTVKKYSGQKVLFNYPNASSIVDITRTLSNLTGESFIVPSPIFSKIYIFAPIKIPLSEAYTLYFKALNRVGFTILRVDNINIINPARTARRLGIRKKVNWTDGKTELFKKCTANQLVDFNFNNKTTIIEIARRISEITKIKIVTNRTFYAKQIISNKNPIPLKQACLQFIQAIDFNKYLFVKSDGVFSLMHYRIAKRLDILK